MQPLSRLPLPARAGAWCLALFLAAAASNPAVAAGLAAPKGPVIMTVTGDISATNRGPYDAAEDVFFKYHARQFRRAAAFDLDMLKSMPSRTLKLQLPDDIRQRTLKGVPLADVLSAVGAAKGAGLTVMALDGYAVDISAQELKAHDWLMAYSDDGHYLGIGGRGPLWLVFRPKAANGIATEEETGLWPWQAFMIIVGGDL